MVKTRSCSQKVDFSNETLHIKTQSKKKELTNELVDCYIELAKIRENHNHDNLGESSDVKIEEENRIKLQANERPIL